MRRFPLILLVGCAILAPVWWPVAFAFGDHLVFWSAGHTVASGGTPYGLESWIALARSYPSPHLEHLTSSGHEIWVYPPWTAFLFVPFGLLPLDAGLWVLHASYVAASIAACAILIGLAEWRSPGARTLVALLAITFQPLVIAARWGQFTSWTLLGVVLSIAALRAMNAPRLITGAILAITKPQYAALPAVSVAAVLARRGGWRVLFAAVAALAALAVVTTALQPRALEAVTAGAGQRLGAFDRFPTSWGFAHFVAAERWPFAIAGMLGVAAVACAVAVWAADRDRREEVLVCASLALGVAMTPYALTYEHALLVPALVSAGQAADRASTRARTAIFAALVVLSGAAWTVFVFTTGAPLGFVPVAVITLLGTAHLARKVAPVSRGG